MDQFWDVLIVTVYILCHFCWQWHMFCLCFAGLLFWVDGWQKCYSPIEITCVLMKFWRWVHKISDSEKFHRWCHSFFSGIWQSTSYILHIISAQCWDLVLKLVILVQIWCIYNRLNRGEIGEGRHLNGKLIKLNILASI